VDFCHLRLEVKASIIEAYATVFPLLAKKHEPVFYIAIGINPPGERIDRGHSIPCRLTTLPLNWKRFSLIPLVTLAACQFFTPSQLPDQTDPVPGPTAEVVPTTTPQAPTETKTSPLPNAGAYAQRVLVELHKYLFRHT